MRRTVDRALLALIGLVLVVAGGATLAVGLGAKPPSWWIYHDQHDAVLTASGRTRYQNDDWWWPVIIAALAVLLLLALWWLSAVLRRRRLSEVRVDTGDGQDALLRGRALEAVLAGEAGALDGVDRAEVALTGHRDEPGTRVRLRLEPHASPGEALHRLTTEALAGARDSARLARLPATVELRAVRHRAHRVS